MKNEKALVTGGAGFIGSHLVDLLIQEGWKVRVLDNLSMGLRENVNPSAEFLKGDVTVPEDCAAAVRGIDTVFHLAARVTIRGSVHNFGEDARINLLGTLNMLEAAGKRGVRRFLFSSSMAVYADSQSRTPVKETSRTEPLSPYGLSKLAAEKYCLMTSSSFGMEPVILRYFNTYGSRQNYSPYVGVVTLFITNMLLNKPCTIFGSGEQTRDFIHVSDVIRATLQAARCDKAGGEIFNVGTGTGTSVNELALFLSNTIGYNLPFAHAGKQESELEYSVADISKAREMLNFSPQARLEERLADLLQSIRNQQNLSKKGEKGLPQGL